MTQNITEAPTQSLGNVQDKLRHLATTVSASVSGSTIGGISPLRGTWSAMSRLAQAPTVPVAPIPIGDLSAEFITGMPLAFPLSGSIEPIQFRASEVFRIALAIAEHGFAGISDVEDDGFTEIEADPQTIDQGWLDNLRTIQSRESDDLFSWYASMDD